ncbi:MAG: extracellular solute-binding protein [Caldilineaceae bacterium]
MLLLLLLAGCGTASQPVSPSALQGRVLLWHTWTNEEATALADVLARFQEIHPAVVIKQEAFGSADEMLQQFQLAAAAGLGPDLMIAPSDWIPPLSAIQLIDEIGVAVDPTLLDRYLPTAVESLRYQDGLYGLPVTLDTMVLYYDRDLVEQPPATLEGLLAAATAGQLVALGTTFVDAFWGVPAFGGQLFDVEQRVILDRGGLANWLAWLKDAREAPGMILESNRAALLSRFITDGIAYYVGSTSEYRDIVEGRAMEVLAATSAVTRTAQGDAAAVAQIGVAPLPAGPTGSAGPFLQVQALLFSTVSSANQRTLALALAQFMTNAEQQTTLMREARLVPANNRVRVNPRLDPVVATFAAQARNAVPLSNAPALATVFRLGGDAYVRVLEGGIEPATAAANTTVAINEANGFTDVASPQFECRGVGTLYLGSALEGKAADALQEVITQLRRDCPTILVNVDTVTLENGANRLMEPLVANGRLDLVVAPQSWVLKLAPQTVLADLTATVAVETLQRYRPTTVAALRYENRLYGLPLAMHLDALYVNKALVNEPALTLDDLRTQAMNGVPIWLDTTFLRTYWGLTAFGGELFSSADPTYQAQLDQGGFADWLQWLRETRTTAGLHLSFDRSAVERQFLTGQSAYLVADAAFLTAARAALGRDQVAVALLPAGPGGEGQSLLRTTGFLYSRRLSPQQLALALELTNYITSIENQTTMLTLANLLPTNAGVEGADDPALATFLEQSTRTHLLPTLPAINDLLDIAEQAYPAVLQENVDPVDAATAVTQQIKARMDRDAAMENGANWAAVGKEERP